MAKFPFAEEARAAMEAGGISFNADGTTRVDKTPANSPQDEPANTVPDQSQQTPEQTGGYSDQEKDRLLEMQRSELEALRREKAEWSKAQTQPQGRSQREIELEDELASLRSELANKTEQEQADEFRDLLERQGFDSENFDDDVLLELRDTFFKPMANKLSQLEKRLGEVNDRFREPTAEERKQQNKSKSQAKILEEIPDFYTIFNSASFQQRLTQADSRFPHATYGETLQVAYENGNADFVIRELKAFMGNETPNVGSIADVGATSGGGYATTAPKGTGSKYTFTDEEALQMLRSRQRGDISRQAYSEYRAAYENNRLNRN